MAEDAADLAWVQERYPGWQFWFQRAAGEYVARRLHAPAAEEPLRAATVGELAAHVAEHERARREAQAYVDAVGRGMGTYFASRARRKGPVEGVSRQSAQSVS
jgi:hypothetical protein